MYNNHKLSDAICVFGTGRCGSSIFFRILGAHPDLAWVSNIVERIPKHPELSALSRLYPLALRLGPDSRLGRMLPRPMESLQALRTCADGLFHVPREVAEEEIPQSTISAVRDYHARLLRYQGRDRLATKHTGFPRFRFLRTVFPNARFVHVIRDGRAVAYSMMRVPWWDGTLKSWWWGAMPDRYRLEYESSDREPAVLAAIVWKHLLDIYEAEMQSFPTLPVTVVQYESFVSNPRSELLRVGEFCGLSKSPGYERAIGRFSLRKVDAAWRRGLGQKVLAQVELVLGEHLSKYGFV